jgi:hypothetical protein
MDLPSLQMPFSNIALFTDPLPFQHWVIYRKDAVAALLLANDEDLFESRI